jgi:pimeloyl-ACP methyl ester carboxylesterase
VHFRPAGPEIEVNARANEETWADMLRLQERGVYAAAFTTLREPVLMLHGAVDPYPGHLIRENLEPCLPQLAYRELVCCGHPPWLERHAHAEFLDVLVRWLARQLATAGDGFQPVDT